MHRVRPSGAGCGDRAASVNLGEGTLVRITRLLGCHRSKPRKTAPDARVGCLARRIAVVQQQPLLAKQLRLRPVWAFGIARGEFTGSATLWVF